MKNIIRTSISLRLVSIIFLFAGCAGNTIHDGENHGVVHDGKNHGMECPSCRKVRDRQN